MVAGLASTVGLGQAMFLKATYQSPPDARGPRSGVERPRVSETLSSAEGHVARIVTPTALSLAPPGASAASASAAIAMDAALSAVIEQGPVMVGAEATASGEVVGAGGDGHRKRILVIGDSLVSGVGGESSFDNGPSDGPALPRQVARYLSEMLNVDVQWNAMSLTGGDVRMLKRKILPMLTRERERGTIGDIWAVVVVTGVNDWKRISPIRTANKFREDLTEFIEKIREQVGEDCNVFLPAIPGVRHTPRFHEPLRSIVIFLNDYWDSQKLQLSRSMEGVHFVGQPPNDQWGSNPGVFFSTLDRVHPSELGYHRWAERIAQHMSSVFRRGVAAAQDGAVEAVANVQQAMRRASLEGVGTVDAGAAVETKASELTG